MTSSSPTSVVRAQFTGDMALSGTVTVTQMFAADEPALLFGAFGQVSAPDVGAALFHPPEPKAHEI